MSLAEWINLFGMDVLATFWFLGCWCGYTVFSRKRARSTFSLSSILHVYRAQWMLSMLFRENRVGDASLLASLERNASFLASTAMLIIAGLVTTLASIETVHATLLTVPFSNIMQTPLHLQFKIMLLLLVFIYSFFSFTWAMRQYGFCAILFGGAPLCKRDDPRAEAYAQYASNVIDQAGLSYNYGLRAYYFSLSVLAWIFSVWLFLLAVSIVVVVLYQREFRSNTLRSLVSAAELSVGRD